MNCSNRLHNKLRDFALGQPVAVITTEQQAYNPLKADYEAVLRPFVRRADHWARGNSHGTRYPA